MSVRLYDMIKFWDFKGLQTWETLEMLKIKKEMSKYININMEVPFFYDLINWSVDFLNWSND